MTEFPPGQGRYEQDGGVYVGVSEDKWPLTHPDLVPSAKGLKKDVPGGLSSGGRVM